jgi:hypothetical protein
LTKVLRPSDVPATTSQASTPAEAVLVMHNFSIGSKFQIIFCTFLASGFLANG